VKRYFFVTDAVMKKKLERSILDFLVQASFILASKTEACQSRAPDNDPK
jgi:hypothetical protein